MEQTIKIFRATGNSHNVPSENRATDEKILEISQEAMNAFKEVAQKRNEDINKYLLKIAIKFLLYMNNLEGNFIMNI